jgi:hypothetical protein
MKSVIGMPDNNDNSSSIEHRQCRQCHEKQPITEFLNLRNPAVPTVACQKCRSRQRELKQRSSRFVPRLRIVAKLIYSSRAAQSLRSAQQSPKASRKRSNTESGLSPSRRFKFRGIYSQDSPTQAEARRLKITIQRRHRAERRAGREVSQTPTLSQLLEPSPFEQPSGQQDDQQHGEQSELSPFTQLSGLPQLEQQQSQPPLIQLGTPLTSQESSASMGYQVTFEAHQPRQPHQLHEPIVNPGVRDFAQAQDPPFTRDLGTKPIGAEDEKLLQEFWEALEAEKMDLCSRCYERWFDMTLDANRICRHCHNKDKEKRPDEPFFFSAANLLDFGPGPAELGLPSLSIIEEMCIARVHVHVNVMQV